MVYWMIVLADGMGCWMCMIVATFVIFDFLVFGINSLGVSFESKFYIQHELADVVLDF